MILIIFIKHYYKTDKSIKIVDSINHKECDEKFFEKYGSMKFKDIFGYSFRQFIGRLFQQIIDINDFDLLYKLYPSENFPLLLLKGYVFCLFFVLIAMR